MQYITVVKQLDVNKILGVFLFERFDGYKPIEESKNVARGLCDDIGNDVEFTIYNPFLNSNLTSVFHGIVTVPEDVEVRGKSYKMRRTQ